MGPIIRNLTALTIKYRSSYQNIGPIVRNLTALTTKYSSNYQNIGPIIRNLRALTIKYRSNYQKPDTINYKIYVQLPCVHLSHTKQQLFHHKVRQYVLDCLHSSTDCSENLLQILLHIQTE
jgi:hypothetical protein